MLTDFQNSLPGTLSSKCALIIIINDAIKSHTLSYTALRIEIGQYLTHL